jgi:hypothetical protein
VTVTETITRLLVHTAPSAYSQASRGFAIQGGKMISVLMIVAPTIALFIVERVFPERDRPEARSWYARAGFLQSVTRQFRHSPYVCSAGQSCALMLANFYE